MTGPFNAQAGALCLEDTVMRLDGRRCILGTNHMEIHGVSDCGWSGAVPGVVTGQVVKERLGLVIITRVCRSLFFLMGDIFRVSSFLPVQRLVVCPFQSEQLGSTTSKHRRQREQVDVSRSQRVTFELELALQLFVDVGLVELGIGGLKVKVFLKLHGAVSAHVDSASAAVPSPSAATVGLSRRWGRARDKRSQGRRDTIWPVGELQATVHQWRCSRF